MAQPLPQRRKVTHLSSRLMAPALCDFEIRGWDLFAEGPEKSRGLTGLCCLTSLECHEAGHAGGWAFLLRAATSLSPQQNRVVAGRRSRAVVRLGEGSVNHLSGGSDSGEQTAEAEAGGSFPGDFGCGANILEAINLLKTHFGPELFFPFNF